MIGLLFRLLSIAAASHAVPAIPPRQAAGASAVQLSKPASTAGVSIEHSPSFSSISIEPAFWPEFVGTANETNELFFNLISRIIERGGQPIVRPGGITMDSMIFDPAGGDLTRSMGPDGEVYRTIVGPAYFESWSNFPDEVSFISTLNFGNNSLQIAQDLALASAKYQAKRIKFFELGNEPNNYGEASSRWKNDTQVYVDQWKNWTTSIGHAVSNASQAFGDQMWWASSATTDNTTLKVRPADVIPKGIDSSDQVGEFSIHSYVFSTCSPANAALATISNLLNHTHIVSFADEEVGPSARAAFAHGKPWVMGEFNSIACSGGANVSDTFTQALWQIDTSLTYAVRNASSVHIHQGATLVLQSGTQVNTPGFSTYDFVYPRDSEKHGTARSTPGFTALLFLAEVFAEPKTRVLPLEAPTGVDADRFSGYAMYAGDELTKLVLLNMQPYYSNSTESLSLSVDVSAYVGEGGPAARFKRLTAPSVDEKDAGRVSWAGQSFVDGEASGGVEVEEVLANGTINIRGSEAVLVFFGEGDVYGV